MFALVGALLLLAWIVELVRRLRLRVGYSLLWLFVGLTGLALVLFPSLVRRLDDLMGIQQPTSLLFAAGISFCLLILLEHSLTLSTLWRQDKNTAQDQALLERRVRQLEARLAGNDAAAHEVHPRETPPDASAVERTKEDGASAEQS